MLHRRRIAVQIGCLALFGAFCVGMSCVGLLDNNGTGTLKVLITDKPYPYEYISEALVYIQRVEVRTADEEVESESDDNDDQSEESAQETPDETEVESENEAETEEIQEDSNSSFITIFESDEPGGKPFNLLDLQNGKTDLLADAEIPAGTYDQMRIVVTSGKVTLTDGREFPLNVPSGSTSGIKLHFTFEVDDSLETVLLLDVDLSRAFTPIPGGHIEDPSTIREFKFSPSLAMRLIEILDAGSISGVVTDSGTGDPLAAVSVTVFDADDQEVTSTATEADGSYTVGGLLAGTYSVEFTLAGYEDAMLTGVVVEAGATTADVNAVLTPAP